MGLITIKDRNEVDKDDTGTMRKLIKIITEKYVLM